MKPLVVYYSYSGITRRLAEDIALITDGDLRELKPQKPYSFSYHTAIKEVMERTESMGDSEVVFIGSPNWLKTFAPPVLSFLRTVDLSNKTIIPFCTHGGGGFGNMMEDYKRECKNSIIKDGIALKADYSFEELKNWLDSHL